MLRETDQNVEKSNRYYFTNIMCHKVQWNTTELLLLLELLRYFMIFILYFFYYFKSFYFWL